MTTHQEQVRADLTEMKPRQRLRHNRRGNTLTGTAEVRAWLAKNIKNHWFFFTKQNTWELWIAFHDKQDAILWKLTWH